MHHDCFVCQLHAGHVGEPPGGYIYEDRYWKVAHGFAHVVDLGTLVIESRRHYLDFADMTAAEAAAYGGILARVYTALKAELGAERIYTAVFMEGAPHFHAFLHPRLPNTPIRGPALLTPQSPCDEVAASRLVAALRARLAP